jgi:Zn-dependent peptidase ImmA (M78 family)/transcriptional regulator with XRE-family HTH domain
MGLTKKALAEKIGVDLRSIVSYESGSRPSESVFARLQETLGYPAEFFWGNTLDFPLPQAVSFRSLTKMSSRQRDMALNQAGLCMHLNAWFESKFELPACQLPDLGREGSPIAAAESLRRVWGIGEMPIRNMVHLLESKGVRVYSLAVESREVDAVSTWKGDMPYVFLNLHKTAEHSRFDAAHELGHLVLHRHAIPQGREAEREADAFASAFLMPEAGVVATAPRFATLPQLIKLKQHWGVSVAAYNYRLHSLSLTNDWQYRTLCVQLSREGYRTSEPQSCTRESSQAIAKMLSQLHAEGISRSQIARDLQVSLSQLNEMIFDLVMTGIDGGGQSAKGPTGARLELVKK